MRQSAQDLGDKGHDKYFGYGLIDVVKAIEMAKQGTSPLSYWPQELARQLHLVPKKYAGTLGLEK
ncbi:hypothetical protein D3C71_1934430 [compost metagenome]